ncbi:hypothetical protein DFJ73DRAFT_786255 [Zopfochytrium polystomum]|nr:hypothetical protein DFJ73DRAFT_786255 [Zopfochytrium polystomum]
MSSHLPSDQKSTFSHFVSVLNIHIDIIDCQTATVLEARQCSATAYLHAPEGFIRLRLNLLVVAAEQLPLDDPNVPRLPSTRPSAFATKWRIPDRMPVLGKALTSCLMNCAVHHPTPVGCRFASRQESPAVTVTETTTFTVSPAWMHCRTSTTALKVHSVPLRKPPVASS